MGRVDVLVNNAGIQHIEAVDTLLSLGEDEVMKTVLLAAQPARRFVTVERVGALTMFACNDSAASITVTALLIDGDWTTQSQVRSA